MPPPPPLLLLMGAAGEGEEEKHVRPPFANECGREAYVMPDNHLEPMT